MIMIVILFQNDTFKKISQVHFWNNIKHELNFKTLIFKILIII